MDGINSLQQSGATELPAIRYIKLGIGGAWLPECLEHGVLMFSDHIPHEVADVGDWARARQIYADAGETQITDRIREIKAFYETSPNDIWITFGQGRL